jgi:hypothetical protein
MVGMDERRGKARGRRFPAAFDLLGPVLGHLMRWPISGPCHRGGLDNVAHFRALSQLTPASVLRVE